MHPDIHEGAERGDVRDHALELHALLEVLHRSHVVAELRRFEAFSRITTWFVELRHDVVQGEVAYVPLLVLREIDLLQERRVADQGRERHSEVLRHLLDQEVALRVNCTLIERVFTAGNPKKPRRLLEGTWTQAEDVENGLPRLERTILVAVRHDPLRQGWANPRHARQE